MNKIIVALVLCLILFPCLSASFSDCAEKENVMITDVLPTSSFEGVGLTNFGDSDADLTKYELTDGEGKITFTEKLILPGHSTLFVCKNKPEKWFDSFDFAIYGEKGIRCKSFALNDNGDEIILYRNGKAIDAFAYGNSGGDTDGQWIGDRFQNIPKTKYAHRIGSADTDSVSDWVLVSPGKYAFEYSETEFDAYAAPFVFPDSEGLPVINSIADAESSVKISIYMITNRTLISALIDRLDAGVDIDILVEGSPAGGMPKGEIAALCTLSDRGADVKAMVSDDGYRRFDYNHSKYAVIDGKTTVITSENWTETSFSGNTGWGAVIYSEGLAEYFSDVFDNDYGNPNDTVDFTALYDAKPEKYDAFEKTETVSELFECKVRPVISPDTSWESMKDFISSSDGRLYAEQLEIDSSWPSGTDNPIIWMSDKDTDCRLIANTEYSEMPEMEGLNIAVRNSEKIPFLHNKGIVSDDSVWIGSVNFVENSFKNNRESAVIINSDGISEFFASHFIEDWGSPDAEPISISICEVGDQISGKPFILDATGTYAPNDSVFSWDTDGDGIADTEGKKIIVTLGAGMHRMSLTVSDGKEERTAFVEVKVNEKEFNVTEYIPMKYIPLLAICAVALTLYMMKKSRRKKNVHKGVRSKRYRKRLYDRSRIPR